MAIKLSVYLKKRISPDYWLTDNYMKNKQQAILQVSILIAILIGCNVVANYFYARVDLTKEKRFTLTDATKDLLEDLDEVVFLQIYLEGEMNAGFKRLRNSTFEMLNEFKAYAGHNIAYEFIDPLADTEGKERQRVVEQLMKKGLEPKRIIENKEEYSEKVIFPSALVVYKGRELPITLLEEQLNKGAEETLNNSIALLEYNLANAIQKLQRPTRPALAFIEGQGELEGEELQDMAATLSKYYIIERVNLKDNLYIPKKYAAAIIAKPTQKFEEQNKYKIDQYLMNGGRVLWLVENMRTHLDSLKNKSGSFIALDYGLNLDDQLFKYGVRLNFDLVQDLQCGAIPLTVGVDKFGNATQIKPFPWLYFPILTQSNKDHPVTKNLDAVLGKFTATLDTIQTKNANIKKTILLKTSPYSRTMTAPIKVNVNDARQKPNPDAFEGKGNKAVAVALEGEFVSPFKNRLALSTKQMIDTIEGLSVKDKSDYTRMVVIADGDIIKNDIDRKTGRVVPLGYYKYSKQTFANKELLFNAIEWLTDEKGIIAARSKDIKLRLLDMQKVKSERFMWQLLNVGLPILLVLLFAGGYNFYRRRKYA